MNILIAPDSFKGSMTSLQASIAIQTGFSTVFPDANMQTFPLADGGEGTVDAALHIFNGIRVSVSTVDPLHRPIQASYGWIPKLQWAVIETAAASGLPLLTPQEQNPYQSSTYGTGILLQHALNKGAKKIIIGLGGSATIDAGMGILVACGMRFIDDHGHELPPCARSLDKIKLIDTSTLDPRLSQVELLFAYDVKNPLLGTQGAVSVFGPQKGLSPEEIPDLEKKMDHFAHVVMQTTGTDYRDHEGSGAAGGILFSFRSFFQSPSISGFQWLAEAGKLEEKIVSADLIITGEGSFDHQSRFGKGPIRLSRMAKKHGIPTIIFCGRSEVTCPSLPDEGMIGIYPIVDKAMKTEEALLQGELLLKRAVERFALALKLGFILSHR